METLLIALLNDLATVPQHSILVLDDYHVLEAPADPPGGGIPARSPAAKTAHH